MWIFKALNCKSCTKGTICVIVLIFLFSAVKLSSDSNQRDHSPKYALEDGEIQDFVSSSGSGNRHREGKKGRRKKVHQTPVPFQTLEGIII